MVRNLGIVCYENRPPTMSFFFSHTQACCGAYGSEANAISGNGETYISCRNWRSPTWRRYLAAALREGRRCEEGGGGVERRHHGSHGYQAKGISLRKPEPLGSAYLTEGSRPPELVFPTNNRNEAVTVFTSIGEEFGRLHEDTSTGPHVPVHGRKRWSVSDAGMDVPTFLRWTST